MRVRVFAFVFVLRVWFFERVGRERECSECTEEWRESEFNVSDWVSGAYAVGNYNAHTEGKCVSWQENAALSIAAAATLTLTEQKTHQSKWNWADVDRAAASAATSAAVAAASALLPFSVLFLFLFRFWFFCQRSGRSAKNKQTQQV